MSLLCSEEMMDLMEFYTLPTQYMHVNYDYDSVTLLSTRLEKSIGS
jgi:hypothetical protein